MRRRMLKSKIHRALVTATDLHYEGSVTIDAELMALADIRDWEQVAVLDIDNGARFETYAIPGTRGELQLNGAAARLVEVGHRVIVLTYAEFTEAELESFSPTVVQVDADNRPVGHDPGPERPSERDPGPERPSERDPGPERPSERDPVPADGESAAGLTR
ncbi:MAG: aspartate 1-decarboxylase [Acidimicrobiales bacterium]